MRGTGPCNTRACFDQQAFILNSRDQIRKAESRELDAEEQLHVRKSTRSRKGRKQDAFDCFLYDEYDELTRNTKKVRTSSDFRKNYLLRAVLFDC